MFYKVPGGLDVSVCPRRSAYVRVEVARSGGMEPGCAHEGVLEFG